MMANSLFILRMSSQNSNLWRCFSVSSKSLVVLALPLSPTTIDIKHAPVTPDPTGP